MKDNSTEQAQKKVLRKADVNGSNFMKYDFEHNGNKFCVNLPIDAKDIVVGIDFDGYPMIGFKTKFGGKKYLQTYTTVKQLLQITVEYI